MQFFRAIYKSGLLTAHSMESIIRQCVPFPGYVRVICELQCDSQRDWESAVFQILVNMSAILHPIHFI